MESGGKLMSQQGFRGVLKHSEERLYESSVGGKSRSPATSQLVSLGDSLNLSAPQLPLQ